MRDRETVRRRDSVTVLTYVGGADVVELCDGDARPDELEMVDARRLG